MLKNYSPHAAVICPQCRNVAHPDALVCPLCGFHFRVQWNAPLPKKQKSPQTKFLNCLAIGFASLVLVLFLCTLTPHTLQPSLVGNWVSRIDGTNGSQELVFDADHSGRLVLRRGNQVLSRIRFTWRNRDSVEGEFTFYDDSGAVSSAIGLWVQNDLKLDFIFSPPGQLPVPTAHFVKYVPADQNTGFSASMVRSQAPHILESEWRYSTPDNNCVIGLEINPGGEGIMTTMTTTSAADDKIVGFHSQKGTNNEDEGTLFSSSSARELPIAYWVKKDDSLLVEFLDSNGQREPAKTFTWLCAPFKHTSEGQ